MRSRNRRTWFGRGLQWRICSRRFGNFHVRFCAKSHEGMYFSFTNFYKYLKKTFVIIFEIFLGKFCCSLGGTGCWKRIGRYLWSFEYENSGWSCQDYWYVLKIPRSFSYFFWRKIFIYLFIGQYLGLQACERTDKVPEGKNSHALLLSGMYF